MDELIDGYLIGFATATLPDGSIVLELQFVRRGEDPRTDPARALEH